MNINGMYLHQMKKHSARKWNPLGKSMSMSVTSFQSTATEEKPKMVIEDYSSSDRDMKYFEQTKSLPRNYAKVKNETESFIFNKVNEVGLCQERESLIQSMHIKPNRSISPLCQPNGYKVSTIHPSQCSLKRKLIPQYGEGEDMSCCFEKKVGGKRSNTPLTSRNPPRQNASDYDSGLYSTSIKMRKKKTHRRDVSAGLVYEQSNDIQINFINIDHMILLEEKLIRIQASIANNSPSTSECFEWWTFYFDSSLCEECYEEFFDSDKHSQLIIHSANNLELFAVLLCYFISIKTPFCSKFNLFLGNVFHHLHFNYLLMCKVILGKSSLNIYSKQKQLWVDKVNEHLRPVLKSDWGEFDIALKIKANCKLIVMDIKSILCHYAQGGINDDIIRTFNNLTRLTNRDLNEFFKTICKLKAEVEDDKDADESSNGEDDDTEKGDDSVEEDLPGLIAPFIRSKPTKPYTLVLDLDETLVSSRIIDMVEGKGKVKFRPGLVEFLTKLNDYYELISFTAANQEYAEPVLNIIEKHKKFFAYRLYEPHTTLYQNDYIKNLSLIGRDLSTILLIDNIASNYRLQPENGILVKPFQAQSSTTDRVLIDLLPILIKIAKSKGDIRLSLSKYKEELIRKKIINS